MVVGTLVVVVVTGLWTREGRGIVGTECRRGPGWAECPLGTLEYKAMKPSEVTLWSDTNWIRRTLPLLTIGLEMEEEDNVKQTHTQDELEQLRSVLNSNLVFLCRIEKQFITLPPEGIEPEY